MAMPLPWRRLLALALAAGLVAPAAPAAGQTEIEAGAQLEALTNGFSPWRMGYVDATHHFAPRQSLYGSFRLHDRFDMRDPELALGYAQPLGERLTAVLEGSYSPTHQVIANGSLGAQLALSLPGGWGVGAGARATRFTAASNTRETLMVERYWGAWRFAYALSLTQLPGAPMPLGHQLSASWYYAEPSAITLHAGMGQEMEFVGPGRLLTTDVKALALVGRHWLSPAWAAVYEGSWVQQGAIYTRVGARLGVRRSF